MAANNRNDDLRKLWRHISESKLFLLRNISVGAAGISLAIILLLLQVGVKGIYLEVSLTASAIGIPFWLALASAFETYIFYGKSSYPHLRTDFSMNIIALLMLSGSLCLITSITALIWHLSLFAVQCFGISVVIAVGLNYLLSDNLKRFSQSKTNNEETDA